MGFFINLSVDGEMKASLPMHTKSLHTYTKIGSIIYVLMGRILQSLICTISLVNLVEKP